MCRFHHETVIRPEVSARHILLCDLQDDFRADHREPCTVGNVREISHATHMDVLSEVARLQCRTELRVDEVVCFPGNNGDVSVGIGFGGPRYPEAWATFTVVEIADEPEPSDTDRLLREFAHSLIGINAYSNDASALDWHDLSPLVSRHLATNEALQQIQKHPHRCFCFLYH